MREMARVITIRASIMDDGKLAESDVGERENKREESGRFARRQHKRVDACAGRLLLGCGAAPLAAHSPPLVAAALH